MNPFLEIHFNGSYQTLNKMLTLIHTMKVGLVVAQLSQELKNLLERMKTFMCDHSHRLYSAANCWELLLGGKLHDIYAVDIYYHNCCYVKFVHSLTSQQSTQGRGCKGSFHV